MGLTISHFAPFVNPCFFKFFCDSSGRSAQQATGLRSASVGAKRVPLGLSTTRIACAISTSNYQDITLTINVSAKNRLTPVLTGTPTLTPTELTYGESLSKIKITGTMKVGDTVVKGTFSWQQPGDTILDASTLGHDVG